MSCRSSPRRPERNMTRSRGQAARRGGGGVVLTAISDGLVGLLKEFFGRGPTRAKTYYHDDLVVCLLRGGFCRVSRHCSTAAAPTP